MKMTTIKEVPLSIHEATISRHRVKRGREFVSTPAIDRLTAAVADMRAKAQRARDLAAAIQADRSFTGEHARQKFSDDAKKLLDAANTRLNESLGFALGEVARVSKAIRPAPLTDKHLASEIRARFAALSPEARDNALADDTVMAAVSSAPPFLSGYTPKMLDLKLGTWSNAKFPAESDELRRTNKALEDARRIGMEVDAFFRELIKTMVTDDVRSAVKTKAALEAVTEAVAE
jgi:hypothetical protein